MRSMVLVMVVATACSRRPVPPPVKPASSPAIRSIDLVPPGAERGDVVTTTGDGRTTQHTHTGLATQPALASNGTIGWVELERTEYRDEPVLVVDAIVTMREGHTLARIVPEKIAEVEWRFVNGGTHVAVGSAGMHGPTHFQLFDAETGRLIEAAGGCKPRPAWTDGIASRCDIGE